MAVYLIAEAGINHNGSMELAIQLIDAASQAGADAIKFQTFKARELVTANTPMTEYQTVNTGSRQSQMEMLKKYELRESQYLELMTYCQKCNIDFLSSPFDLESVEILATKLKLPRLKIPSGEINNAPLLLKAARMGKDIILSSGMSNLGEIEMALAILAFGYITEFEKPSKNSFYEAYSSKEGQKVLKEKLVLLHCTSEYPAPFEEVNLKAMDSLKQTFGLRVGYSDHTQGIAVPVAAAARGAVVVEKHFTLDCNLQGPDHKASLDVEDLKQMVKAIRQVEQALGNGIKIPVSSELRNLPLIRKSLITRKTVRRGERFTAENLGVKRPGTGISPLYYWEWLGRIADRDYEADELVEL